MTIHGLLVAVYQGRFQSDNGIVNTWLDLLRDLDAECVLQATRQLASHPGQWPPTLGDIRSLAVDLSMGTFAPVSKYEAWERAIRLARGEVVATSPEERRALDTIGGTWQIKNAENLSFDRNVFMGHYEELVTKNKQIATALPAVKQVADMNTPALPPAPKPNYANELEKLHEVNRGTPEEISEILKGYRLHNELRG